MRKVDGPQEYRAHPGISIWKETLCGFEFLLLHCSPIYYGFDVPSGDGSAVIVIPGFRGTDPLARNLHRYLQRIGYRTYPSGIGVNQQCPNMLINDRLRHTVMSAVAETGRRVHVIGHSLGGMMAHSLAIQMPREIASVVTLGSPLSGIVAHPDVFHMAEKVRRRILQKHSQRVHPTCYTGDCRCEFSRSLRRRSAASVLHTAIYTRHDGVVDWKRCLTDDPANNFEVPGTHLGLLFNQSAYEIIAHRLRKANTTHIPQVRGAKHR